MKCHHRLSQPRALIGRHQTDHCSPNCRGCLECPSDHCGLCGIEHTSTVCDICIGVVRGDLRDIAVSCRELRRQAAHHPHDSAPGQRTSVLGGDAMVMLGPVSDGHVDQLARHSGPDRLGYAAELGYATQASLELPSDVIPPLLLLATWEDDWRSTFGHEAAGPASITAAREYLDRHLHHAALYHPAFVDFANEIRQLRTRLEDLLHDERVGYPAAPCSHCRTKLVRDVRPARPCGCPPPPTHDQHDRPDWICCLACHQSPSWEERHAGHDQGGAADQWRCPSCAATFTRAEYEAMVARDYRDNAAALSGPDLEKRTGVRWGTVRVWAARGKVTKRGRDAFGRQLYDVADVERHAESTDPGEVVA